ncbi:MAG TPA: hypothetical protein VKF62_13340 [Planctomycetota bacterium]|nr:hypothetical protein [Planctomycetota bacterium]
MFRLPLALLSLLCASGATPEAPRMLVRWEPSLEAAQSRAAAEGKPILFFHLLGRLDETFA